MNSGDGRAASVCWQCGRVNPMAAQVDLDGPGDKAPEAGDVSVCIGCAAPAIFTGVGLEVRRPTFAEWRDLAQDPLIVDTIAATEQVRRGDALPDWLRGSR